VKSTTLSPSSVLSDLIRLGCHCCCCCWVWKQMPNVRRTTTMAILASMTRERSLNLCGSRTQVGWRPGLETSLAPPCSDLRSVGSKYCIEDSTCDIVRYFSEPGELWLRSATGSDKSIYVQNERGLMQWTSTFWSFTCTASTTGSGQGIGQAW